MPPRRLRVSLLISLFAFFSLYAAGFVEPTASAPNSDPTYLQLRNIGLSNEAVSVSNVDLKREAGTFHLRSGTVCFLAPVQGKVTGAVFIGDGNFVLQAPNAVERNSLFLLTREQEFSEVFTQMVLRFTDHTYDELKKAGTAATGSCDVGPLHDSQHELRKKLHYNVEGRILQDVLNPQPGALFIAFVHGKHYSDRMVYSIDPHGASPLVIPLSPEEVQLVTYDDNKTGVWAAFHLASEYANGTASGREKNAFIHIEHQVLDTTIEKSANLIGKATTTFVSQADSLRVVPFDLFGTLRVQHVASESGQPLSFIQEDKKEDPDFFVILPKALGVGEKFTIVTSYSGKEAVSNEGGENYYPVARNNWYPNNAADVLGEYTLYDLTLRVPKGMKMAATGNLISESMEGSQSVTVWKSEVPLTVAGFNFGLFKEKEGKIERPTFSVTAYANQEVPDVIKSLMHQGDSSDLMGTNSSGTHWVARSDLALGTMTTTGMINRALAEGQLATQLFTDYFGPNSFHQLAMTQQTNPSFGQSWPGLVWLPITYFYDTTIRHELRMDDPRAYFKVVAPHEVAHQWWGHTVGFNSYRDQWMSEGFADMSASLYLQNIYSKEPQRFLKFWEDERELMLERNKEGFRAIDAGPLTMGYRLSNSRAGSDITRRLIYPKGAYVLHMIRMMMMDRKTGDQQFKETMQDFVKTYANHAATTEDFKAVVEKHMTPEMDLDGNHRLDWFFNEYVYGTALPSYKLDYTFDRAPDGVVFNLKLSQSNVDEHFKMLVPIYLEMPDGKLFSLGRARMLGNTNLEQKVPLKGLKDSPKRAAVNYYFDVLAAAN